MDKLVPFLLESKLRELGADFYPGKRTRATTSSAHPPNERVTPAPL
jgi:hypothetical protein